MCFSCAESRYVHGVGWKCIIKVYIAAICVTPYVVHLYMHVQCMVMWRMNGIQWQDCRANYRRVKKRWGIDTCIVVSYIQTCLHMHM